MTKKRARRIGVLTGGGDAPGLNAAIRAVVKTGTGLGYEILGIQDGYEGLLGTPKYCVLTPADVRGLLPQGGTILHTTSKGHFGKHKAASGPDDPYAEALPNIERLGLTGLVSIGGEGTMRITREFHRRGVPVVGVPKTIDNDLAGTDRTFGFDTALQVATDAIDRLHTTAASHNRVMVLEVMGRNVGWIALHSGIAGGADVILIPEIPFDYAKIAEKILAREKTGSQFSIVVAAEGAFPRGGKPVYQEEGRLGGIANVVSDKISELTGKESRCVVLGHVQRGGSPTPYDRILATRFGAAAVAAVHEGQFGKMVALHAQEIVTVNLDDVCGKMKSVPADGEQVRAARGVGIAFGD